MVWFKVDDGLHSHPKALAAGDLALGLWVRLGSWSSHHRTDGHIPTAAARMLGGSSKGLRQLVAAGLLEVVHDGYLLHDYLDYNPSRRQITDEREATAARVAAWRASNKDRSPNDGNGVTGVVTNAVCTPAPTRTRTRPDPNPVLPTEEPTTKSKNSPSTTSSFEHWYAAYPRHVGRQDAAKAYARAVKTVDHVVLLTAAVRFADDPTRDPAFTPHPATWLNQGRWDDEGPARPAPRDTAVERTASGLALVNLFASREQQPPTLEIEAG